MVIIPVHNGYIVTNGIDTAKTFDIQTYGSRDECRNSAFSFASMMERLYPEVQIGFSKSVKYSKLFPILPR